MASIETERGFEVVKRNAHIADTSTLSESALFRRNITNHKERSIAQREKVLAGFPFLEEERKSITPTNSGDITLSYFETIFQDADPGRRERWLKAVDQRVEQSTKENLQKIDEAALHNTVIKKDLVIVGGGPLTAMAACILGPYYDLTVITQEESIGKPWRDRPIFVNSNVADDHSTMTLPFLSENMLPIKPNGDSIHLGSEVLLHNNHLEFESSTGEKWNYISGQTLGKIIATTIAWHVSDFIAEQKVTFDRTKIAGDGSAEIEIIDNATKKQRTLRANTILFLTGPGEEICKIEEYKEDYEKSERELEINLRQAKNRLKAKKTEEVAVALPSLLSLSMLEKLYGFWDVTGRKPELYPLQKLFQNPRKNVGILGNGDAAKAIIELLQGHGPREAYPGNRGETTPQITVYSPATTDSKLLAQKDVSLEPYIFWHTGERKMEIVSSHEEEVDRSYPPELHDYLFVATGMNHEPLEKKFSLPLKIVTDEQEKTVGVGNSDESILIGGSATGFTDKDLPGELHEIITSLGLPEHIITLWVHGLLTQRLCWTIVGNGGEK